MQKPRDPPDLSVLQFMPTERCAKLMAVGMANNLDEVWISTAPALQMVYFKQYLPNPFRWYVLLNVTSCFCDGTAVFNWVSKVVRQLLWFWFCYDSRLAEKSNLLVSNWFSFGFTTLNIEDRSIL